MKVWIVCYQYFEHLLVHVNSFFRDTGMENSPNVIKVADYDFTIFTVTINNIVAWQNVKTHTRFLHLSVGS